MEFEIGNSGRSRSGRKMDIFGDAFTQSRRLESIDMAFYRFAAKCFREKVRVVFKGGCLIRHILGEFGEWQMRGTRDLDFDLCEETYLIMEEKWDDILRFNNKLRDAPFGGYMVNAVLYDGDVDCDVHVVPDVDLLASWIYTGPEGKFYGARVEAVLSDKIVAMSSEKIVGRGRDLIDIKSFVTNKKIVEHLSFPVLKENLNKRILGDFSVFNSVPGRMVETLKAYKENPSEIIRICEVFVTGLLSLGKTTWTGSVWK